MLEQLKQLKWPLIGLAVILLALYLNPFFQNPAGSRSVWQQPSGKQGCRFEPGIYYAGFFANEKEWPNQISVSYKDSMADASMELVDNTIEIGQIEVRFGGDAATAKMSGIAQFILPNDEESMLNIHNVHRTPESLVRKRLMPYTKECLQSSAQLMSSEMHYSGGRVSMVQDYINQLQNGSYILKTIDKVIYDSLDKEFKRVYKNEILTDKNNQFLRKASSLKEYGITTADANITEVDYQNTVDAMLEQKIIASTTASVSKQKLITAMQEALTKKAEGEKKLVEIEYQQKQEQTRQVVAAATLVEVAKQDLLKQEIAEKAASREAAKIKILADANAYQKRTEIQANGALEQKLRTYETVQKNWADAFSKYQGNIVPQIQSGGGSSGNGAVNFMEMMGAKAARDLSLDLKTK